MACREERREVEKRRKASEDDLKPELLEKVREFIYQRETVSRAGVEQEFFRVARPPAVQHHLSVLEKSGLIESSDGGQTYEWAYLPEAPSVSVLADPARAASRRSVHAYCTHPSTQAGREKCRKSRGHVSPSQTTEARRAAKQAQAEARPPKPDRTPEEIAEAQAKRRSFNSKGGLTAPKLARFIHERMKNDREYKGYYRFTMEWVRLHYPHLVDSNPEIVNAALQYLVDKGRISALPK